MAVLALFAYFAGRNPQVVPRGAQNVFEFILEALNTLVENTAGHYARRVFPLVATLFLFIVTANYMGMLPGVGTIYVKNANYHGEETSGGHAFVKVAEAAPPPADPQATMAGAPAAQEAEEAHELPLVPLFRSANADVNMTLAMGLIAFLFIHGSGIAVHGLKGYWTEDLANPPLMAPMKIIIECFVPISLSMRLFGNIFGGEMLLTVMQFPIVAVPFMVLELLFGFIQAVIFFMLTLIFTSLATHLPGGHGEDRLAEGHAGLAAVAQGDEHASAGAQQVAPAHT
jgi:F-type H+-transporting ATPase subunit a